MPPMPPMGPGGRKPGGPHGARLTMEKPKDAKNTLKKLIGYIGRNRYLFFALIGVMLIITLLNLAAPSIQQIAIDCITLTKKKTSVDFGALGKTLIGLGAVYLLSSVFTYMQGIFSAKLSQYTVKTMRKDLFSSLVRLPIKYLDTHSHGDIMSRMTNDVENISTTISQSIGSLISGVLTIVGTVVIMLLYSPLLTLISLSTVFLTIFVSGVLTKYMKKYFIKQQVLLGEINGEVEEMVVGYRTVVSYGKEQDAVDKFEKMSNNLKKCGIKAQIFGGVMGPCMNLISNFGFILIAAFGGWFAIKGFITVGTIQAFILYSKQFSRPINEIANQFANIQTAIAGAERIFEVMDADKETDEGKADFEVENVKGDIDFKHIDFSYVPEKQVLKDLDLEVKAVQVGGVIVDSGKFDWTGGKFPCMTEPDESYHGTIYTEKYSFAPYIVKARMQLMRDFGCYPAANSSFLLNLGLETLPVRMKQYCENALTVAKFLESNDKVESVAYPGLESDKYHKLAEKYLPLGTAGVISFVIKGGRDTAAKFMDSLKLASNEVHVADIRTCILHPASATHRQLSDEQLVAAGINGGMIRLSVGLENVEDIIDDLKQGFAAI